MGQRGELLRVRVSSVEKAQVAAAASRRGKSSSDFVRECLGLSERRSDAVTGKEAGEPSGSGSAGVRRAEDAAAVEVEAMSLAEAARRCGMNVAEARLHQARGLLRIDGGRVFFNGREMR